MATLAGVASGVGINMAVVTGGVPATPLVGLAAAAAGIGSVGNDRFCGRCLGGTDLTACRDPANLIVTVPVSLPLQSICSKSVFKQHNVFVIKSNEIDILM